MTKSSSAFKRRSLRIRLTLNAICHDITAKAVTHTYFSYGVEPYDVVFRLTINNYVNLHV